MDLITALAVSIGVLGGIATFVLLSPFGLGMQIWVAFIAWATFYHCGGKEEGLTKALTNNIFGAIMALIAVFILVYAAKAPALSDIPAGVLGYAAVAGLALTGNKLGAVTSASLENPFVVGVISLIIGAVLGYISQKIALAMAEE